MDVVELVVVAGTGIMAGTANSVAGGGSLLTYPVLVALGLGPVAANVTNDIGVAPGNVSGAVGLRHDLAGQRRLLRALVPCAVIGSLIGATVLLLATGGRLRLGCPSPAVDSQRIDPRPTGAQSPLATRARSAQWAVRRSRRHLRLRRVLRHGHRAAVHGHPRSLSLRVRPPVERGENRPTSGRQRPGRAPVRRSRPGALERRRRLGPRHRGRRPTRSLGRPAHPSEVLRIVVAVIGIGAAAWPLARQLSRDRREISQARWNSREGAVRRSSSQSLARGRLCTLVATDATLTTQRIADLLGLSRTYVIRLIESEPPTRWVWNARSAPCCGLPAYKQRRGARLSQVDAITYADREVGLEYR
jgi:hypothetical protein